MFLLSLICSVEWHFTGLLMSVYCPLFLIEAVHREGSLEHGDTATAACCKAGLLLGDGAGSGDELFLNYLSSLLW